MFYVDRDFSKLLSNFFDNIHFLNSIFVLVEECHGILINTDFIYIYAIHVDFVLTTLIFQ